MHKANHKLSVIIPLYNHEKFIKEAIHSVLEQSFSDFELIVINDGSTDNSEDVVKGIRDDRIKYFSQENQGAHNTINRGIHLAQGEYVSILNSDDVYYQNRFEDALKVLESDSSIYAVFSHIECIDGKGRFIRFIRGAEDNWIDRDPDTSFKGKNDLVLDLLAGNFLVTTSNLFCKKKVFDDIGYFLNLRYTHDYEFFLRLCYRYKAHIIETPLLKYRIHDFNTVKENEAEVDFEIGLILANFLLTCDLQNVLRHENDKYTAILKLFNSINTRQADRMIMVLLLSEIKVNDRKEWLFEELVGDSENSFRKGCLDSFRKYIDLWQNAQEAWGKWSEANDRLVEIDKELERTRGELERTRGEFSIFKTSYSYRLGRVLTWPVRKLLAKR
jgi:glycosyltransferase involved in cell wall biosynthesis